MSKKKKALKFHKTNRGFAIASFNDRNGVKCSLQASSIATESCIWFGCDDAEPQVLANGGWRPVEMPAGYVANTRMHLTQDQVKELLPALKHFAKTGYLPEKEN